MCFPETVRDRLQTVPQTVVKTVQTVQTVDKGVTKINSSSRSVRSVQFLQRSVERSVDGLWRSLRNMQPFYTFMLSLTLIRVVGKFCLETTSSQLRVGPYSTSPRRYKIKAPLDFLRAMRGHPCSNPWWSRCHLLGEGFTYWSLQRATYGSNLGLRTHIYASAKLLQNKISQQKRSACCWEIHVCQACLANVPALVSGRTLTEKQHREKKNCLGAIRKYKPTSQNRMTTNVRGRTKYAVKLVRTSPWIVCEFLFPHREFRREFSVNFPVNFMWIFSCTNFKAWRNPQKIHRKFHGKTHGEIRGDKIEIHG